MKKYVAVNLENAYGLQFDFYVKKYMILIDNEYVYVFDKNTDKVVLFDYKTKYTFNEVINVFENVNSLYDMIKIINKFYAFFRSYENEV